MNGIRLSVFRTLRLSWHQRDFYLHVSATCWLLRFDPSSPENRNKKIFYQEYDDYLFINDRLNSFYLQIYYEILDLYYHHSLRNTDSI